MDPFWSQAGCDALFSASPFAFTFVAQWDNWVPCLANDSSKCFSCFRNCCWMFLLCQLLRLMPQAQAAFSIFFFLGSAPVVFSSFCPCSLSTEYKLFCLRCLSDFAWQLLLPLFSLASVRGLRWCQHCLRFCFLSSQL